MNLDFEKEIKDRIRTMLTSKVHIEFEDGAYISLNDVEDVIDTMINIFKQQNDRHYGEFKDKENAE